MAPISSILAPFAALAGLVAALPSNFPGSEKFAGVPVSNINALNVIPQSYIVVYNSTFDSKIIDDSQAMAMAKVAERNLGKRSEDGRDMSTTATTCQIGTWRGLMLDADDQTIMEIMADPAVRYVEADAAMNILIDEEASEMPPPAEITEMQAIARRAEQTETGAPNGLARLSQSEPNPGTSGTYRFEDSAGEGITVYIVDTGIRATHTEFEDRATFGANFIDQVDTDQNGHGSHCAGTIGGKTFGVAKKATLVGVKVLGASGGGSNRGVIQGMQFVANDVTQKNLARKAVMNMSLGGSKSTAVNEAINSMIKAGVVAVVAAGNENDDASKSSPASAPGAITVGAIDQKNDRKASFSNFGTDVDIFAPGVNVLSVDAKSDTGSKTLSGTSMASPHVAGLAAYLMALDPTLTAGGGIETVAGKVDARIKELAKAMGAQVGQAPAGTTTLIANNGKTGNGAGNGTAAAAPADNADAAPATGATRRLRKAQRLTFQRMQQFQRQQIQRQQSQRQQ
ncbi:protease [Pyricularia oryzae 70-15]|uniref:Protease n=3 Tax=Pyricularia oryzae TaxID=318829 RepID=G4MQ68_PYRO7|nr:protease [Pyricularia oryzae 70-15]EHA57261.1 protease [Pyricularia oryzae 70-15]ELQ41338.1 oryzin [Pyricularia oryzae Y34]KAI7923094.1 protease [Pyricularia oryzae]KAI7926043.1 protease [Pyricularia oryzae]